jgi:hypothetical protein
MERSLYLESELDKDSTFKLGQKLVKVRHILVDGFKQRVEPLQKIDVVFFQLFVEFLEILRRKR